MYIYLETLLSINYKLQDNLTIWTFSYLNGLKSVLSLPSISCLMNRLKLILGVFYIEKDTIRFLWITTHPTWFLLRMVESEHERQSFQFQCIDDDDAQ